MKTKIKPTVAGSLVFFIIFIWLFGSLSFAQLPEEKYLIEFYREALIFYKQDKFVASLLILNEIRKMAPHWQVKRIEKYINLCREKIAKQLPDKLKAAERPWWEVSPFEKDAHPAEILFSEYKNLLDGLAMIEMLQVENRKLKQSVATLKEEVKKQQKDLREFSQIKALQDAAREKGFTQEKERLMRQNNELSVLLSHEKDNKLADLQRGLKEQKQQLKEKKEGVSQSKLQKALEELSRQLREKDELLKQKNQEIQDLKNTLQNLYQLLETP